MAWFPCNLGGGSTPQSKSVSYLKWQILKTRSVPASGSMQVAEFYIYQNASKYSWPNGVSITSNMQGVSGEGVDKLIDGNTGTKFNTNAWGSVQVNECNIVIELGETITLDGTSAYSFVTPNNEITRDPISWKLYGSEDGTNWDLLDQRNDVDVPTNRFTETQSFPMQYVGGESQENYVIEQGSTYDSADAGSVNTTTGKLYMFYTGNHSGTFTNADLLVGSTSYFELLDGIGVAAGIVKATSSSVIYDGAWSGEYHLTEIDILKNEVEDFNIECNDKSNWTSTTTLASQVGDYYIIADTVDNDGGTVIGAETLVEETLTVSGTNLNIKIRIVKATSTSISLSSGNNLNYRKFSLVKEI